MNIPPALYGQHHRVAGLAAIKHLDIVKLRGILDPNFRMPLYFGPNRIHHTGIPPLHHHYGLTIQIGDRQSFFLRPYANDYNFCIEEAQNDQRRDARPELKSYPDSIASYDDIYLGFPNYWGTMPMPVFTFLQHFDFSGKTIHPFCTHEGSGLGRSLSDIQRLCTKALIAPALAISGTHASQSSPQVHRWLTQSLHAPSASHSQHKTI